MKASIHVCLLTSARIFDISYGGEGKFTASLANWLAKKGQEVTIMASGFAGIKTLHMDRPLESKDNPVGTVDKQKKVSVIYPPYSIYLLSRLVMSVLWTVRILLLNLKSPINLIHAQDTGYTGLAAVISGKIIRVPVIISSHGIRHKSLESVIKGRFKDGLQKFEKSLDLFSVRNADNIIAINPAVKKYFDDKKVAKQIDVIPIPIKVSDYKFSQSARDQIRAELGIEENTIVIGFVGRFSSEKNILTLLTAFASVAYYNSSVKLVLVGGGYLESQLKEYVRKQGIGDDVIFCGIRYDISRILTSFDIFVLPSYAEGFGAALLEAMAVGRACICSDIPTFRGWITANKEALFIDPNNPDGLKNAIELLSKDSLLRSELGKNAASLATQYDEDIVFPKLLLYYEGCLQKRKNIRE